MDDGYRLLKLISLVGWSEPEKNQCGLRYETRSATRLTEKQQTDGHMMVSFYSGAVRFHHGGSDTNEQMDHDQLPGHALKFVTRLSDDAIAELGEMVAVSLAVDADPAVLGRQWVDDVTATCWRLALARHKDRFGSSD